MLEELLWSPWRVFAQCATCVTVVFKDLFSVICVFVHEHTHLHTCGLVPWRPEEGLGCPGVGVTGGCDMGLGN